MQEIGRCGRDGAPAVATLHYNATDIAANVPHLQDAMRDYCKLSTCRRVFILHYYGFSNTDNSVIGHACCDNCASKCSCSQCMSQICEDVMNTMLQEICLPAAHEGTGESKVSKPQSDEIRKLLMYYFAQENSIISDTVLPGAVTGLSDQLAKSISRNAHHYRDTCDLELDYPELSKHYLMNIVNIINAIL